MGPTDAPLVWIGFHFLFPSFISQQIELYVTEYGKKKKMKKEEAYFLVIKTEL